MSVMFWCQSVKITRDFPPRDSIEASASKDPPLPGRRPSGVDLKWRSSGL